MSVEFFLTSLVIILMPGTGVIYTVAAGLTSGRRTSIVAAFGCTLGILPHITASVLGLAAVLHTSAVLFQMLKYAGVVYLVYLAWQTWKESGPLKIRAGGQRPRSFLGIVRTGFLINILNPKLSVFFLAFLPQFVSSDGASPVPEMIVLGAIFMVMTFAVFAVYGSFAAIAGEKVLNNARIMQWMRRTVAVAFAAFGLRLALAET